MIDFAVIECDDYTSAQVFQIILESGDQPAVAASVTDQHGPLHIVVTTAPNEFITLVADWVTAYAKLGERGIVKARETADDWRKTGLHLPGALPAELQSELRHKMQAQIVTAAGTVVAMQPSLDKAGDPGDEHTEFENAPTKPNIKVPAAAQSLDAEIDALFQGTVCHQPVQDPRGDSWDNWKSQR